ncbi:MAG: hypothetical protein IMZ61_15765, partial [Planctomycetes bacterium]|nr:hypothetical protein [Planctomycetota bacterium]
YKQIIDAICTKFGYTATYETPASAIWSNIFYPTGRTLTLQSPHLIFTLLRQKLLIYALDDNDNEIYFRQWLDDQLVGVGAHPSIQTITTFDWKEQYSLQYRQLTWLDETHTVHNYPNPAFFPDLPLYNLGYLEAAAATPTYWQSWHANEDKRTFHLKYQDGDIIHCSSGTYQIQVTEIFNPKESPSLYLQFIALPKFSTTEGGPLPSNIEAAGNYIPLNVSNFTKNLTSSANNLQTFADAVDEMTTGPAMYAGSAKDPLVDADVFPVIDSETATHVVKKFTWANLKARVFAAFGVSLNAATTKDPPVDADLLPLMDSELAGKTIKGFSWVNLKSRVYAAFAISLAAATEITAPADDDLLPVSDVSLATDAIKRFTWANLKATLKTYFYTLLGAHNLMRRYEVTGTAWTTLLTITFNSGSWQGVVVEILAVSAGLNGYGGFVFYNLRGTNNADYPPAVLTTAYFAGDTTSCFQWVLSAAAHTAILQMKDPFANYTTRSRVEVRGTGTGASEPSYSWA